MDPPDNRIGIVQGQFLAERLDFSELILDRFKELHWSGVVFVRLGGVGTEKRSCATRSENVRTIGRVLDAFLIGEQA